MDYFIIYEYIFFLWDISIAFMTFKSFFSNTFISIYTAFYSLINRRIDKQLLVAAFLVTSRFYLNPNSFMLSVTMVDTLPLLYFQSRSFLRCCIYPAVVKDWQYFFRNLKVRTNLLAKGTLTFNKKVFKMFREMLLIINCIIVWKLEASNSSAPMLFIVHALLTTLSTILLIFRGFHS